MFGPKQIVAVVLPGMDGTGELVTDFVEQVSARRPVQAIAYPADRALGYGALLPIVSAQLPNAPTVLVAESFSGPLAIELAASDQRVVGLVLASSFARCPIAPKLATIASLAPIGRVPASLMAFALLGSAGSIELRHRVRQVLRGLRSDVVRTRLAEVMTVNKLERLRDVECPILYLKARSDRLVGTRSADEIKAVRPSSRVLELDGPHMLLETHPEKCADAIDDFCKRLA